MNVNKRNFFKKLGGNQFKRKGVDVKKGKRNNSGREQSLRDSQSTDTVYRILCPSRKIGGVIGKGGSIIKTLREETQARITVADSVPGSGSDDRVIIIYSSPTKTSKKQHSNGDSHAEIKNDSMVLQCAAQDALLKVHDRIVEEDLFGGVASDDDNGNLAVTVRLLVPNNMVGCLLGKRGDVIQRLRSETGANIRVLPADHLSPYAMDTDELVQISGKPGIAKRALYEVSTLLHQNPREENPPQGFPVANGGQGFHSPGAPMKPIHAPQNSMWTSQNSDVPVMPPAPWMGVRGNPSFASRPSSFNDVPPGDRAEASIEFSMKILCSAGKIGGVIGKGGANVKQIQQGTGASIHVEDASTQLDERVIRVSAFEGPWNPRSQTIDAILELQNKTSEFLEKGAIVTRLLVSSSKVGCLLGQGGQVINEMRRRTHADIRVYSKDDKPKCASEDEELVQISGNLTVAKDALTEIASRLRLRTLRDSNPVVEPAVDVHGLRFGTAGSLAGRGPPPSHYFRGSSPGDYESVRGELDYELETFPMSVAVARYPNVNNDRISNLVVSPPMGMRGRKFSSFHEVPGGARFNFEDPEHLTRAQNVQNSFTTHAPNLNAHESSYERMHRHRSPYQHSSYQNINPHQSSYQNMNKPQSSHQTLNAQQSSYRDIYPQQGAYSNINAPLGSYYDTSSHQHEGMYRY